MPISPWAGTPRNAAARHIHGFLSRDGIAPRELLRIAREQLRLYDTVELRDVEVAHLMTFGYADVPRNLSKTERDLEQIETRIAQFEQLAQ